ncbi:fructosamine kinase family protein [Corynebacterium uterequi]|uniref:Fructosamine-3-kinase n=1 Tax=Corynebacterium uterequi TaxID=1072256 RepID=A0A0G3HEP1_9CORY|nr:fructosamine kinase family protein [Corynebacterium uterequi]AKK11769.1 fructosamine-3-kinase [Corynebacterium uterequi]
MALHRKKVNEPGAAAAEAAGLRWLREASHIVVDVVDSGPQELTMEAVPPARPTAAAAREAGRELAAIHDAGAGAFGSPPPGWPGPFYIGRQEQSCQPAEDWASFYVDQRVDPFAAKAHRLGHLSDDGWDLVRRCLDAVRRVPTDDTPSRLHGDLWAGNLLFGADGPRLIDPAAHGGHRETDLAMLYLFGAPYLEELIAGYEEVHPLRSGWRERIPLHQLHPLAVHAASHGPSYGRALVDAAQQTLSLLAR